MKKTKVVDGGKQTKGMQRRKPKKKVCEQKVNGVVYVALNQGFRRSLVDAVGVSACAMDEVTCMMQV